MKILVACEESQAVTIELRRLGHEAYSCDLEPCSGGHPEWHLRAEALEAIRQRDVIRKAVSSAHATRTDGITYEQAVKLLEVLDDGI